MPAGSASVARPALVVVFLASIAFLGPAVAQSSYTAEFDPVPGNEWWVEVYVSSSDPTVLVEAREDGGPWVALEKKSWGSWAKSFHVASGSIVEFRAHNGDGDTVTSGGYLWPDATPATGGGGGEFGATFDPIPGNEWWVEVKVNANQALAGVDARDDGGPWIALEKKSWGAWAKSFHVQDGSVVEFRARSAGGDQVISEGYIWPQATPASGGGGGGGAEFSATFDPIPGNEWWVEVKVNANQALAGVDARDDGGPWIALEKKSWGAWAKSFHVQDGSIVEFRARSTGGDQVVSDGYVWPQATPANGGGGGGGGEPTNIAFGPRAGNAWWIETFVVGQDRIDAVDARANGGAWHALTERSWGTWAGSFHAPAGSTVEFRATAVGGRTDTSDGFRWPDAAPIATPDAPWPREGSYVRYATGHSDPAPTEADGHDTMIYHHGGWWVWSVREGTQAGASFRSETYCEGTIPIGPTDVSPGDEVDVGVFTCGGGSFPVTVIRQQDFPTHRNGNPITTRVWFGDNTDPCLCLHWEAEWDTDTGMTLSWARAGRSFTGADLEDTNAPLG